MIVIMPAEALEEAKRHAKNPGLILKKILTPFTQMVRSLKSSPC